MMALEGIKVLDLSRNTPGQFCTMILGDLGADVLKVERPMDGDRARYEQVVLGLADAEEQRRYVTHHALERNKRSIALNLKEPEAVDIFHRLAKDADVVVEGFRPGTVKRLGVDYERVRETNPRIIYCSVSGYGQDGPYSDMAGHDINYISLAGVLDLIGSTEQGARSALDTPEPDRRLRRWWAELNRCHSSRRHCQAEDRTRPVSGHRHDRRCLLHDGELAGRLLRARRRASAQRHAPQRWVA